MAIAKGRGQAAASVCALDADQLAEIMDRLRDASAVDWVVAAYAADDSRRLAP